MGAREPSGDGDTMLHDPVHRWKDSPPLFSAELLREKPRGPGQRSHPLCLCNCAKKCGPLRGKKERTRRTRSAGSVNKDERWSTSSGAASIYHVEHMKRLVSRIYLTLYTWCGFTNCTILFIKVKPSIRLKRIYRGRLCPFTRNFHIIETYPCLQRARIDSSSNPFAVFSDCFSLQFCLVDWSIVELPSSEPQRQIRRKLQDQAESRATPSLVPTPLWFLGRLSVAPLLSPTNLETMTVKSKRWGYETILANAIAWGRPPTPPYGFG